MLKYIGGLVYIFSGISIVIVNLIHGVYLIGANNAS